jgi:hypothetical protein
MGEPSATPSARGVVSVIFVPLVRKKLAALLANYSTIHASIPSPTSTMTPTSTLRW